MNKKPRQNQPGNPAAVTPDPAKTDPGGPEPVPAATPKPGPGPKSAVSGKSQKPTNVPAESAPVEPVNVAKSRSGQEPSAAAPGAKSMPVSAADENSRDRQIKTEIGTSAAEVIEADPAPVSEPDAKPAEPAAKLGKSAEPAAKLGKSAEPAAVPAEPAAVSDDLTAEPAEPAAKPAEPASGPAEPASEPAEPVEATDASDLETAVAEPKNQDRPETAASSVATPENAATPETAATPSGAAVAEQQPQDGSAEPKTGGGSYKLLAFVLEVAMLGAAGLWAIGALPFAPIVSVAMVAIPLILFWGVFMSPQAGLRFRWPVQPIVAHLLFAAGTGLLFLAEEPVMGAAMGFLTLVSIVLTLVQRRTLLESGIIASRPPKPAGRRAAR